jgi:shikimate kinase
MIHDLEPKDRPRHGSGLVLVGYRGTGKSTIGQILANRLNRRFVDADPEIEARAGRSISQIFAELGEPAFRDWEEATLRHLAESHPGAILATGGGAVVRPANRRILADHGLVVWLKAEPGELARRLEADHRAGAVRPSLTGAGTLNEIAQVMEARIAFYAEVADVAIETMGHDPEAIVEQIVALWPR